MMESALIQRAKRGFLQVCKALGLFRLARRMTARGVRILCYHGFSMEDEVDFRPSMYMPMSLFDRRLRYLREQGYPVLGLDEALRLQEQGELPAGATVITIDDGWYSTYRDAFPALRAHEIPATLYVTTYHMEKGTPVFGMLVSYLFWKSPRGSVDLRGLGVPALAQTAMLSLSRPSERGPAERAVIEYGESCGSDAVRMALVRRLGDALEVDVEAVLSSRKFALVNEAELGEMGEGGVDIQLHTHRHRFPANADVVTREIEDNRAVLARVTDRPLTHFCYPSGVWSNEHWPVLEELGVVSATTCEAGLAYDTSHRLALARIVDTVGMSDIEFDAVMSGFMDVLRRAVGMGAKA